MVSKRVAAGAEVVASGADGKPKENMATTCSDHSVLAGLFLAAYSGNLAEVKSVLKNNALSADVADPNKVCEWACERLVFRVLFGLAIGFVDRENRACFLFFWVL